LFFVEERPLSGRVIRAAPGTTIGRDGCDVRLLDPEASRRHAVMRQDGDRLAIQDLGSTNGTWVNGLRCEGPTRVRTGDVLRFGNTVWYLGARSVRGPRGGCDL
jgi:pSer/pThr/pTyr-binding forkhead associated (FHA) protein